MAVEMFEDSDKNEPVLSFPPTWQLAKQTTKEDSSMTDPISYESSQVQSIHLTSTHVCCILNNSQVQTIPLANNDNKEAVFSMDSLLEFLGKVEPQVSSRLLRNLNSSAFDGYMLRLEDQVKEVSLSHRLKLKRKESESGCTDITWSKSGSTIAAAYGSYDHESWCTHKGHLATWNISRANSDVPTFSTEVSSCLMSIAFHPELPSVIAGGTFGGEVAIWQTNDSLENSILASSGTSDLSHEEPISCVSWVPGKKLGNYNVLNGSFNSIAGLYWD